MKSVTERGVPPQGASRPTYLTSSPHREHVLWRFWYDLTAAPEPKGEASFQQMEHFRRGRTVSQIIPALYVLLLISIPARFVGTNTYLTPIIKGGPSRAQARHCV